MKSLSINHLQIRPACPGPKLGVALGATQVLAARELRGNGRQAIL